MHSYHWFYGYGLELTPKDFPLSRKGVVLSTNLGYLKTTRFNIESYPFISIGFRGLMFDCWNVWSRSWWNYEGFVILNIITSWFKRSIHHEFGICRRFESIVQDVRGWIMIIRLLINNSSSSVFGLLVNLVRSWQWLMYVNFHPENLCTRFTNVKLPHVEIFPGRVHRSRDSRHSLSIIKCVTSFSAWYLKHCHEFYLSTFSSYQ